MDKEVDPCDDFYAFSCGSWLKYMENDSDVSLAFSTASHENAKVLNDVMQQGWPLVGELYDSCMNFSNTSSATADDASLKVLSPVLKQIAATKNKKELFRLAGALYKGETTFLTEFVINGDAREATVYALYALQAGL